MPHPRSRILLHTGRARQSVRGTKRKNLFSAELRFIHMARPAVAVLKWDFSAQPLAKGTGHDDPYWVVDRRRGTLAIPGRLGMPAVQPPLSDRALGTRLAEVQF
jgi:hypothetical protein